MLGENHPDYAKSLNNLAGFYEAIGNYEKAEPMFLEALRIRREVLGENHPSYATSLDNLAGLYQEIGSCVKAEPMYLEAMRIRKEILERKSS
ncbi:MAG: tetratricopeptide repeat protein [Ignavibacteria bacterium]|nr:tetratricopeptide repeat protein [Ignavibacteria bacterium]